MIWCSFLVAIEQTLQRQEGVGNNDVDNRVNCIVHYDRWMAVTQKSADISNMSDVLKEMGCPWLEYTPTDLVPLIVAFPSNREKAAET